jgi:hypothetical protein
LGNYHCDQDKVALNNACGRTVLKFQVIIGPYFIKKMLPIGMNFLKVPQLLFHGRRSYIKQLLPEKALRDKF